MARTGLRRSCGPEDNLPRRRRSWRRRPRSVRAATAIVRCRTHCCPALSRGPPAPHARGRARPESISAPQIRCVRMKSLAFGDLPIDGSRSMHLHQTQGVISHARFSDTQPQPRPSAAPRPRRIRPDGFHRQAHLTQSRSDATGRGAAAGPRCPRPGGRRQSSRTDRC